MKVIWEQNRVWASVRTKLLLHPPYLLLTQNLDSKEKDKKSHFVLDFTSYRKVSFVFVRKDKNMFIKYLWYQNGFINTKILINNGSSEILPSALQLSSRHSLIHKVSNFTWRLSKIVLLVGYRGFVLCPTGVLIT